MRITFIKENRDAGTESISTCDTAAFITRIKSETKPGHVSALRTMLEYTSHGSGGTYGHIDKLPRICPATEYGRNREGGTADETATTASYCWKWAVCPACPKRNW